MKNCRILMSSVILWLSLWILHIQAMSVSEATTKNIFTVVQRLSNKKFVLGVLWNVIAKAEIDCAMVCSGSIECLAFIHEKRDQRCLGYQKILKDSFKYDHYPGALYFSKEHYCGTPPKKEYANVDIFTNTSQYYCDSKDNFPLIARGDPMSYCLLNGSWSNNNFTCKVVESCRDVVSCNPAAKDGHFMIYPELTNRHPVKVFCHNMNSNPAEYITLYEINMSVNNGSKLNAVCILEEHSGYQATTFRKIRINVTSMLVVRDEFTFADLKMESFSFNSTEWIQPPFGYGADCSGHLITCPRLGHFIVNLKGTGLRLDPKLQWKSVGYDHSIDWFNNGSFAEGWCGGWCGSCSPTRPMRLYIDTEQNLDTDAAATVVNCSP